MNITKQSNIGEILDKAPQLAEILNKAGMHCLGCPSARAETIEQACYVHETDADKLVKELNEAIAK